MQAAYGSFAKSTGAEPTATNVISGLNFRPEGLILWSSYNTADGSVDDLRFSIGFSDGTTDYSIGNSEEDAQDPTDNDHRHASKGLTFIDFAQVVDAECDVSFDADGFTLTWTENDSNASIIHFLALEGVDVEVGVFNGGDTLGNQTITTTLEPDTAAGKTALLLLSAGVGTDPPGTIAFGIGMLGMALSASEEGVCDIVSENARTEPDTRSYFSSSSCIAAMSGGSDVVGKEADFVEFVDGGTPGFTVDWTLVTGSLHRFGYMMIKARGDGAFRLINETQPGSTGDQILGLDGVFDPIAALLESVSDTLDGTVSPGLMYSIGGGTRDDPGGGIWVASEDATGGVPTASNTVMRTDQAKTFMLKRDTIDTGAPDAECDLDLTGRSAVLDWTTVDATAREFLVLLFGNEASFDLTPGPDMVQKAADVIAYGEM